MDESENSDILEESEKCYRIRILPNLEDRDCEYRISEKNVIWSSQHVFTRRAAFYFKINEYFENGTYTDVNIICQDDEVFKCHRVALAAVSEYFHLMFGGNFAENRSGDVVLRDIDSVTFEQILRFVYRGEIVAVDDGNVFSLLRASEILRLIEIEDACVHYLTQKNIPMDYALEIYLFASGLRIDSLTPAAAQFVLQHLDCFCQDSEFLRMPFDDFSTLLAYFQASSSSRDEKTLLNAIFTWVCSSTDVREERKSAFVELVRKVEFKFVSETYVSEYFDRNLDDKNDERRCTETSDASDLDSGGVGIRGEISSSLHVYVRSTEPTSDEYCYRCTSMHHGGGGVGNQTQVFSFDRSSGGSVDFHESCRIEPAIDVMRIVESAGRLYSLKFHDEKGWSFTSSSSIDLSADVRSLAPPSGLVLSKLPAIYHPSQYPYEMCGLQKDIYLCDFRLKIDCQRYNTELETWYPVPAMNGIYELTNLMSDGTRLYYLHGLDSSCDRPLFAAFDPRAGKIEVLNNYGLNRSDGRSGRASFHRGRIYLPRDDTGAWGSMCTLRMAIYDPSAGRWDVQNFKSRYADRFRHDACRLASFNDRLWMFDYRGDHFCIQTYDSHLQMWDLSNHLVLDDALPKSWCSEQRIMEVIVRSSL